MIRKALPEVKLIFSMRNPVDRAYSALNHYRQIYPESKDWGVWFPDKSLLYNLKHGTSFNCLPYTKAMRAYLEYFPKEQVHLIIQEQLQTNPQEIYDGIFNFLGVGSFPIENKPVHARDYEEALTPQQRQEVIEFFRDDVADLEEFLGYKIEEWHGDFA